MARPRVGGRSYVSFIVDNSGIKKGFREFASQLALEVSKEIKSTQTHNKILSNVDNRLKQKYPGKSGRITAIMSAMRIGRVVKQIPHSESVGINPSAGIRRAGVGLVGRSTGKDVRMSLVSIKAMNERTRIATLDAKFRPRHKASFSDPRNPRKRIGSPSSYRYSLWSILERRNKTSYPIIGSQRLLAFTKASDGYTKWHRPRSVMWRTTKASTHANYLLNNAREVYDEDKRKFKRAVESGVVKYLTTKSRFRL
jgi:hypothetical protein